VFLEKEIAIAFMAIAISFVRYINSTASYLSKVRGC
jgi:hypothetical protein